MVNHVKELCDILIYVVSAAQVYYSLSLLLVWSLFGCTLLRLYRLSLQGKKYVTVIRLSFFSDFFFWGGQSLSVFETVSVLTVHSLWDTQPDFHCCYYCILYFQGKLLQKFKTAYEGKTSKGYGSKHPSVTNQQEEKRKWCKNRVWTFTGPTCRGLPVRGGLNSTFAVSILHWLLRPFCCGSQLEDCTSYWASKKQVGVYQTRSVNLTE